MKQKLEEAAKEYAESVIDSSEQTEFLMAFPILRT